MGRAPKILRRCAVSGSLVVFAIASGTLTTWIVASFFYFKMLVVVGPSSDVAAINLLEIVYFIGNTIAILGTILLFLGIRQFEHAENTRRASVYLEVSKRYNDVRGHEDDAYWVGDMLTCAC